MAVLPELMLVESDNNLFNFLNIVNQNIVATEAYTNRIIKKINETYCIPTEIMTTIDCPPSMYFDSSMYQWIRECYLHLEHEINYLIDLENRLEFIGPPDYLKMMHCKLWIPNGLIFNDEYLKRLNNNWNLIVSSLNRCSALANTYCNDGDTESDNIIDDENTATINTVYRKLVIMSQNVDPINTNGGTYYNNRLWMATGSNNDHTKLNGSIELRDADSYTLYQSIPHNLGHGNGVDNFGSEMLFYSENDGQIEVSIYAHPEKATALRIDDTNNTLIILKGIKSDGSACFGPDNNHIYHAARGTNTDIWISYIRIGRDSNGKCDGTSAIEWQRDVQVIGDMQPQDMLYRDGELHIAAGQKNIKDFVFRNIMQGASVADVRLVNVLVPQNSLGQQEIESILKVKKKLLFRSGQLGMLHIGTVDW